VARVAARRRGQTCSAAATTGAEDLESWGTRSATEVLGDYTWRYRLWQELDRQQSPRPFVGHRNGTENLYDEPGEDMAIVRGQPRRPTNYGDPDRGY